MDERKRCSGFGEKVCQFIAEESSMTGDPLEAYNYLRVKGVGEVPNIPEGF